VELEGLDGRLLEEGRKLWVQANKAFIIWSLNKTKNYTTSQVQKFMKVIFQAGREDEYPNVDEIRMLAQRKGFAKNAANKERMEQLFDVYHDELIPKVALHCRWAPNKRHHGCLSTHAPPKRHPEDKDPLPYIHDTTEAYLVWLFEAHYHTWKKQWSTKTNEASENGGEKATAETEPDNGDDAPKEGEEDDKDDQAEASETNEDPKAGDAKATIYNNPKAGRSKFGGWTELGKEKFDFWRKEVKKARSRPICKQIEEAALQRIRYVPFGCFLCRKGSKTAD
jgi:hypothetical protein